MDAADVIEGDCLEVMRKLPEASFDALIMDPPFGIGKDYAGERESTNRPEEYWAWLEPRYQETFRLMKPGAFMAIWQSRLYLPYLWSWFGKDIHIYVSAKNFVQIRPTWITSAWDPVVLLHKPPAPTRPTTKPPRNLDFHVGNTAKWVTRQSSFARKHPYPRPIDTVREIIRGFTHPGMRILDPFLGSGTTAVAALLEGRACTGIEVVPEYAQLSRDRLAQWTEEAD